MNGKHAWTAALVLVSAAAAAEPLDRARDILQTIARSESAKWELRTWEKLGARVEENTAMCVASADRGMKLDFRSGRASGARLFIRGEQVQVRPPGALGFMRLSYDLDSPRLRGLRGGTPRSADVQARAREVLAFLPSATVTAKTDGRLVAEEPSKPGAISRRATLEWREGRHTLTVELLERGEVVERAEYQAISLGVPVASADLAL